MHQVAVLMRKRLRISSEPDRLDRLSGGFIVRPSFADLVAKVVSNHLRHGAMPTIALVDDDRDILDLLSFILESEGYHVVSYTDGAAALRGFKTSLPDLAIVDIKMPRMDGVELLCRLREWSDVPVIFLTSIVDEIDELVGHGA